MNQNENNDHAAPARRIEDRLPNEPLDWSAPGQQQPAPIARDSIEFQKVREAVASALGDAYDCTRHWSAWHMGTMTSDDFTLVADQNARLDEIVDAVLGALPAPSAKQEPSDQTLAYESALEGFISVLGIEESGSVLDDAKTALDKLNGILAAPSASASPSAPIVPQAVRDAVARMCQPLDESRLSGATAKADAFCMGIIKEFIDSLSAAPVAGSQQVPEGFTLVPVKTNEAMRKAIWSMMAANTVESFDTCYAAMLAAAPAVPVPVEQGWKPTPEQAEEWAARNGVRGLNPRALALAIEDAATLHLVVAAPSLQQGKEGAGLTGFEIEDDSGDTEL